MTGFISYLILALLAVVAIILGLGLLNMLRGGSNSRSQNLMRLRVLAQFVALIAMVAALLLFGRS